MKQMKYISLLLLVILFMTGCKHLRTDGSQAYRVLVIHSNDSLGEDGLPYQQYMAERFVYEGIDADIHHYYADLIHTPKQTMCDKGMELIAAYKQFNPQLIIVDGDGMLNILTGDVSDMAPEVEAAKKRILSSVPIVYGGINLPDKKALSHYKNATGFVDEIDLKRNLQMVSKISGSRNVLIELDHFHSDSLLQAYLKQQIKDNVYEDNSDFHVEDFSAKALEQHYPGKIVVSFISAAEPETNVYYHIADTSVTSMSRDRVVLRSMLHVLKENWLLQVKNDVFSSSLLRHSEHPQFTAIRARFNNPEEARLLCGYFSSMETQINDVVNYGARILMGENPQNLQVKVHKADYYMDYNAMRKWNVSPIRYDDFSDEFHIINAPFKVRHPWLFWSMISVLVILLLAAIVYLGIIVMNFKTENEKIVTNIMRREKIRRLMLIESQQLIYWFIDNDIISMQKGFADKYGLPQEMPLSDFGKLVMIDSQYSWKLITEYGDATGANKVRIHLQLTPEEQHWIEFRFNSTHESSSKRTLMGTAVICDTEVEEEKRLDELNAQANESALRQSFLSNLSQSIRNPLNAVLGFSQLIAAEDMDFSKEERQDFNKQLKENAQAILQAINDTLEESRIEIGDVQLRPISTSARDFMMSVYQTTLLIMPSNLELRLMCDAEDAFVMMAPAYTHTVINAMINNAIKFTVTGYIEIGYKVEMGADYVKFYCKDTGIGISADNLKRVFDRYFKVFDYDKGSGLGLTIAKTIVEKEEGTIGAESKEGVGSTFWFTLKKVDANRNDYILDEDHEPL